MKDVAGFDELVNNAESKPAPFGKALPVQVPPELRERFLGDSQEAESVRENILKAAQLKEFSDKPVLILGDTGSGKDIVAEEIHNYGRKRSGSEMRVLNCGAIPYHLFESILFGIRRRFATGVEESIGLWEIVHNDKGTLFLDEIGELDLDHQGKVLRALEEKKIRRVGELHERSVENARILAATNRDLIRMIEEGRFRDDLYNRLAQIVIRVPRLSANPQDIRRFALQYWREVTGRQDALLSPEIIRLLNRYSWPGNVRELHHFMQGLYFQIYGNIEPSLEDVERYFRYLDPRMEFSQQPAVAPSSQHERVKSTGRASLPSGAPNQRWIANQVKLYRKELPKYETLGRVLREILENVAPRYAPLATVQVRIRSAAAFAEKILRTGLRKGASAAIPDDSCGARVIVQTTEDVQRMASFFERYFAVNPKGSCRAGKPSPPGTFSFQPVSYVIRLNREQADRLSSLLSVRIPNDALGLWAEVQIRTVLEQAWANISIETSRESPLPVTGKWAAELTALGELLKAVDKSFSRIQKGFQVYDRDFSAYASREDLLREVEILQAVLACDPSDAKVAARAGKLAMALGDWDLAIRFMSPFENSGYPPLLRNLGTALCQKHRHQAGFPEYGHGQALLQSACAAPGSDPDAFASLAGTWKRKGDLQKARDLYLHAHVIDPADSYALGCYLEMEMKLNPASDIVTVLKPSIELAVERCRDLVPAGVNLPWALFDLGKFHLLLGRRKESLSAYSRAIRLSTSSHMIRTSLESLDWMHEAKPEMEILDESRQLLAIGLSARFPSDVNAQELLGEWPAKGVPMAPVVILTGHLAETQVENCQHLIKKAFHDFRGTLMALECSGGLKAAVPTTSPSYEGHMLQAWIDIIRLGIRPESVLIFGRADRRNQQRFFEVHSPTRQSSISDQRHYVNFAGFSNGILLQF
jgi:DNA-binding NtrC family response regulator/tetratricopeptide (TPR) repeat protein